MATQNVFRSLVGYIFTCLLAVTIASCSSGDAGVQTSSDSPSPTSPITPTDPVPVENYVEIKAVSGPIIAVRVGETVVLNDTKSYANSSQPLSYSWSFSSKPDGSNAVLQDAATSSPSFIADVRGVYMLQVVVSAEGVSSQRAITSVIVTDLTERPTGPFNHQGLPSNCVNCHHEGLGATPIKPPTHIASSNACEACHTPQAFNLLPFNDHQEVFGSCSECHNGVIATGKSIFHELTTAECDQCHNTTAFLELNPDGSFDHSAINRPCTACHNGEISTGMPAVSPIGTHPDTRSECGSCHTTASFLPAFPDHNGSDVVGKQCDSCHNGATAAGQPAGHPVTSVDCTVCHGTTTFSMGGVFDHSVVDPAAQPCADCHDGNNSINAIGKSTGHIATTQDCSVCHNTTNFIGAVFDHSGIVDNCASCHGVTATAKPANHMPTSEDCSVCHSLGTFTSGSFDHAGVVNNCESCHNTVIATGKLINHLPTTEDCSVCHSTTGFVPASYNHQGIDTANCALCHNNDISVGKPAGHVPTGLDCSSCHVTNNFTTFAGITFNHLGIDSSNCASCHDTGIATGKSGATGTHVHIPAQDDCSVCHNSTSTFTSTTFLNTVHKNITRGCEGCHTSRILPDRPELTKSASHLPTQQDCDSCHTVAAFIPSIFSHAGINNDCASCHDGVSATGKSLNHISTTQDCAVCHNMTAFLNAFVDHSGPDVVGKRCESCHNGVNATGKGAKTNPPHVPTTDDCDVCHVAGGAFVPAVFNHVGIVNNCASCHDGASATGKTLTHLPTTEDCSVCHNTTAFIGASFDHTGIVDNCASCHDGITARGKTPPPDHVPTNRDCSTCHVTTGFLPATFDHNGIVENCVSCHNGVFATGKTDTHVLTNQDCSICHNTSSFTGTVFNHNGIVDNCASCHGVTATGKPVNHLPTTEDCSVCHVTASFVGAVFDHTGIVDNCSSCHNGVIASGMEAKTGSPHIATTQDCNVCHSITGFAGGTFTHDASTQGHCDSCHNNTGGGATSKPVTHLTTNEQCDMCHTIYGWKPSRYSYDPVSNSLVTAIPGPIVAAIAGDQVVLNDTLSFAESGRSLSYSWSFSSIPDGSNAVLQNTTTAMPSFVADVRGVYMVQVVVSAGGVTSQRAITTVIVTEPAEPPTGPVNHQGFSSNCVNCHNEGFTTTPSKPPAHMATSNTCQACHTPQGFTIIPFNDHQEVFGVCSECHNGSIAIGKSAFHAPTTAECDNCHNTTAFLELNPDGSFDHTGILRECSGCHNGTIAGGQHEAHIITSTDCGYCHTTASFLPAYPDHTGADVVGKRCDSCHNDTIAAGWPTGHPLTSVDCDVCHSIVSFSMNGVFDHSVVDPVSQPCADCHNGNNSINAIGKTAGHIATAEDCSICHNTTSFIGAVFDHTGIVDNCASCHGVTAIGKHASHMPTSEDCSVCHTPGTFTTGTFSHAQSYIKNPARCDDCHNNVISVGMLANHLPTAENCDVCHNTTAFVPAAFAHQGIDINNCAQCHNGDISTGKPAGHVPTILDCSSCHDTGNFSTFAGITFNHLGIDSNNCASCHNTGIATGKSGTTGTHVHIPAQDDCSVCHDSTSTFTSTSFLGTVHQAITRGCEGCHVSQFFPARPDLIKSASHLPTAQDCDTCHTVAAFVPSVFSHAGITGGCVSCHDGSADHVAAGARGMTNTPIHNNTSSDCSVCHNTTNFLDAFVDHGSAEVMSMRCDSCHNGVAATGKDAKTNPPHVPTTEDCNVCHLAGGAFVPAVFSHEGIVNNCASCHDGVAATGKTSTHLPTTEDCSVCHNTTAFIGASFDHTGIVDNCASCHDGITAPGKTPPPDHVPTNQDCSVCHLTTGFLPATFSHAGITDNCISCHNNVFATGKSISHVPTSQDCGVCHNTSSFIGAVFDHTGIVDNCASCHDGVTAIGTDAKTNPAHLATNLDCHYCHTTASFLGGIWVHGPETANTCDTCHNGTDATGLPRSGHFITTVQCDNCHTTTAWAPASTYRHPSNVGYPGDHNASVTCISCHRNNNQDISGFPDSTYGTSCAACHDNDYDAGSHRGTLRDNQDCGRSGCHRVSARSW